MTKSLTPAPLTAEELCAIRCRTYPGYDGPRIWGHIAHQSAEIAANLKREQETVNQLAAARGEIARLEARLALADTLADAVQTAIYAQTDFTIDIVGLDKMKAQRKALEDYRKGAKP